MKPFAQTHHRKSERRRSVPPQVINGIFYVMRAGCPWRLLPNDLPPWGTIYRWFAVWRDDGGAANPLHRARMDTKTVRYLAYALLCDLPVLGELLTRPSRTATRMPWKPAFHDPLFVTNERG